MDSVSIGQKYRGRWDFREQATQAMHGMSFDLCDPNHVEHIMTLVIMLKFHDA